MPTAILDAKLDLKQKLTSWALLIGEDGEYVIDCDDNTYSIAGWIYTKADWLAGHPAAEDFCDEIEEAVRSLTLPYTTRTQLEFCGEHMGEKIYVRQGQATVTLPDGSVEQVKTLKAHGGARMLGEVRSPKMVADIIRTFFGFNVTEKMITTAHSDDHNPERRRVGPALEPAETYGRKKYYRVSDVLERFGMSPSATEVSAVS